VDTGASGTVIARQRVAETGLTGGTRLGVSTAGGEIEGQVIKGATIRIGSASLARADIAAINLDGLSAGVGRRIDGILGYELFARYVVQIDYDGRRMLLLEPGQATSPAKPGTVIPFEIREKLPFFRTNVRLAERQIPVSLLIDTGATGALTLYAHFLAQQPGLVPAGAVALSTGALLPGQVHARLGRAQRVDVGRFRFSDVVTTFSSSLGSDDAADTDAGQIGGELLGRFLVTFDYGRGRMTLSPSKRYREPFLFDASGLSLAASGDTLEVKQVRTVIPGTPAAGSGLLPGDIVTHINRRPAADIPLRSIRQMLRRPNRTILLDTIRHGRRHRAAFRTRTLV
jgi:predicted aspartyl protease